MKIKVYRYMTNTYLGELRTENPPVVGDYIEAGDKNYQVVSRAYTEDSKSYETIMKLYCSETI